MQAVRVFVDVHQPCGCPECPVCALRDTAEATDDPTSALESLERWIPFFDMKRGNSAPWKFRTQQHDAAEALQLLLQGMEVPETCMPTGPYTAPGDSCRYSNMAGFEPRGHASKK